MIGSHCIKTWSASQGAVALSSAEAEFYAMIEAICRAKGLVGLAKEMGFGELSNVIYLGTDSAAAKSFVNRRGLGKMRHIDIRDLWLQKEVAEGKAEISKIPGEENPADLMTKIRNMGEITTRLGALNVEIRESKPVMHIAAISREFSSSSSRGEPIPPTAFARQGIAMSMLSAPGAMRAYPGVKSAIELEREAHEGTSGLQGHDRPGDRDHGRAEGILHRRHQGRV